MRPGRQSTWYSTDSGRRFDLSARHATADVGERKAHVPASSFLRSERYRLDAQNARCEGRAALRSEHMEDAGGPAVVLRPGVPGMGLETLDDGTAGYPSTSDDVIKLLLEQGVVAEYDRPLNERSEVTHKAADVWLPVLEIVRDLAIGILGGCIVELVAEPASWVHAKVGRKRKGETSWLEISGQRDEVIAAIDRFLEDEDDD